MTETIPGIHHITAIAGDPQGNLDFYNGTLGLRLVKRTVNFDDPTTYHLYYGNEMGEPGTILTFFPWRGLPAGRGGYGQVTTTAFSVPEGSLGYWRQRLDSAGTVVHPVQERFEETAFAFEDPDGLQLELVEHAEAAKMRAWEAGPVPEEHAIRGFHAATLCLESCERTASLFTEVLGFEPRGELGNRFRFQASGSSPGRTVDLVCAPELPVGRMGVGTVHHIAWRTAGEAEQRTWREKIIQQGLDVTRVLDRNYFRSIYFREPGGILFEIATDPPGFAIDEPVNELGSGLKLPDWLEPARDRIEAALPPLIA